MTSRETNILRNTKLIGLLFIALIAAGVWSTYAVFTKKFTDYDEVSLETSRAGLNLPARADVKLRGVIVGEVLQQSASSDGAELTLGLYPDQVDTIPRNVTARIEPKTLFGEKYVALQIPESPDGAHIEAGDTITQTVLAHEVEETLNDLYPLLRTVQPAEINTTLNALATALEGRGEKIGENLETLDSYLQRVNPQLPDVVEDLRLLAKTSDLYTEVFPDIATTLRSSVTTGNTLVQREKKLNRLFDDVSAFSDTTRGFLDENEDNIIRVNELADAQFEVLGKYAPEFPCLTSGIVKAGKLQAQAFRGFTLHINLEMLPHQPRAYGPQDKPRYGDKRGPYCGSLPDSPYNQKNIAPSPGNADDGVDEPTGKGTMRSPLAWAETDAYAGSADEAAFVRSLLAASLGRDSSEVSDLSVMLFAPLVRGTEVSMR
ncbi:MCE family protein [Nocardioides guangzhouensis]|uniref:MCE family protein n=1 Tax=Nocardioides guangzhouensis TaxID=2497878 RepID=A0A4V1XYE1_9ACTN|nr:MCE family protein [Nocardioides guangzhouensis]RYP82929.1 MCE family protein [Nocardioides guangzhouensis]